MTWLVRGWAPALILLLLPCRAGAWNNAGHHIIAGLAYQQLPSGTRQRIQETLAAHPAYEGWKRDYAEDGGDLELGVYLLMRASAWPDDIRRKGSQYDHPAWHYVDYPLKSPKFPFAPRPSPDDDLLYGIGVCERTLASKGSPDVSRAVYLSYLAHLVGDLHQPLHCGTLYTPIYPYGDKGGNDFYVKPAMTGIKLHFFWDGLLGTSGKPRVHFNYGLQLQKALTRKSLAELKKAKTPVSWSLEGRAKAIEAVYLYGKLNGATHPEQAPELPKGYSQQAKALAERQASLAGYRLADEISRYLR